MKNSYVDLFRKEYAPASVLAPNRTMAIAMGIKLSDFGVGLEQIAAQASFAEMVERSERLGV